MTENEIAKQILDAAFLVHTKLGPVFSNRCMRSSWLASIEEMNYIATIGLEVHVQLKTRSKNVLRVPGDDWRRKQILAHLSDLPGSAWCIAGDESRSAAHDRSNGLMLGCDIAPISKFDRKIISIRTCRRISDFTIRHAALHERQRAITRSGLPERCAEKYRNPRQGNCIWCGSISRRT